MKNLFFVSVAVGIFSGTSISVEAQTAVDAVKFSVPQKRSVQFIEGIEIKRDVRNTAEPDVWIAKPAPAPTAVAVKKISTVKNSAYTIEQCSALQFKYAQIMDVEVELLSNTKLFEVIDDWWGTRYHYGGTTKKGIDCSAFASALISDVYGLGLPRTAKDQFDACEKVDFSNLTEGDLVFFNTRGGVSHVGVYLTHGYFVHSSVHGGVTINSLDEDYYNRKFIGAGRPVQQQPQQQ